MTTKSEPMMIIALLVALASVCMAGCVGTETGETESETSSESETSEASSESGESGTSDTSESGTGESESGTSGTGETGGEAFHPSIVSVGCHEDVCIAAFGEGAHAYVIRGCEIDALVSDGLYEPIDAWPLTSCESGSPAPDSLACFAKEGVSVVCYALIDGWAMYVMPECEHADAMGLHWPFTCAAGEPVDGSGLLDARCDAEFCSASLGPDFGDARVRLVPECMANDLAGNPGEPGDPNAC
jgi:hypothetical protein